VGEQVIKSLLGAAAVLSVLMLLAATVLPRGRVTTS